MTRRSSTKDPEKKEIEAFGQIMSLMVEIKPSPVPLLLRRSDQSAALGLNEELDDDHKKKKEKNYWSELPVDIVTEILQRLQSYQDFVCATSTCRSFWRLQSTNDVVFSGGHQFPWLMLAEEEEGCSLRAFYNVLNNKTCYLEVLPAANCGRKRCVSWRGWFVTVDSSLEINVVHPLSRVQFKLPDISTSLDLERHGFDPVECYDGVVQKAAFSSSPGSEDDYTLSIISATGRIAVWRKGDVCWREIDKPVLNAFSDIVFYKGRFYGVRYTGLIYAWDTQGSGTQVVAEYLPELNRRPFIEKMYLVESGGSLLLVLRESDPEDYEDIEHYGTYKFQVFEVEISDDDDDDDDDDTTENWGPSVSDLGGRSLFLGYNSSFSIDASDFPGCKPNCIYFTDDLDEQFIGVALGGGKDMGVYHLEDGSFEHFPVKSFCFISPPLWFQFTI